MKIAILDGYNLMHRARFGMKGENSTIFTFFRSLRPLIETLSPDKVYLVLEGIPIHRQMLDPEYKANRRLEEGTPQWDEMAEFRRQKRIIINLLENLPITIARHPDLECDDTIASLVDYHSEDQCVVVSTDTDFIQLLNRQNVELFNPVRKSYVDSVEYDYVAWKSLRGDKTDNIPSVSKMTDKAAEKLLANPAALEKFLSEANNRSDYERNLNLVQFKIAPIEKIDVKEPVVNYDSLRQKLTEMRFFSMTNQTAWSKYVETFRSIY
jgi:5'-3' exonuclease